MGSVKLKDLKAFVRYDGSGRVVSGSLVFRKKKPKNGRWGEITKNLCCTDSGTTTTTTTSVTPTAFTRGYWTNAFDACNTTTSGEFTFYSTSTVLEAGIAVYIDAALTIPVYEGRVLFDAGTMIRYNVGAGGVLSVLNCSEVTTTTTTTTPSSFQFDAYGASSPSGACSRVNPMITVYANTPSLNTGVNLFMDAGLSIIYNPVANGMYLSIYFAAQDQVCTMGGPFGNTIDSYTAC
jgi:hypothetical protein